MGAGSNFSSNAAFDNYSLMLPEWNCYTNSAFDCVQHSAKNPDFQSSPIINCLPRGDSCGEVEGMEFTPLLSSYSYSGGNLDEFMPPKSIGMGEVSFGSGGQQHVLDGFQVPDQDSDFFEHEENTGTLSISEHTSSWPKLTFDPCEFHLTDPKFPCINLGDFNMSSQPTFNALSSTSPSGAGCVSHSPGPDESRLSTASLYSSPNSGMEQTLVPSDLPDTQRSQRFYCLVSGCTKNYKRKHELKRHQKHHSGVKLYQCTVSGCNRSGQNGFVRKDHLGQHMKKVHSRESSL